MKKVVGKKATKKAVRKKEGIEKSAKRAKKRHKETKESIKESAKEKIEKTWEKKGKSAREKQVNVKAIQPEINIGLIGHVDSGKTSLVQALTGKWTDTHSEELKRGISIRLGYADTAVYKCEKCKSVGVDEICAQCHRKGKFLRKISFVDAPGHETLMATMLSGAALMHGAILVVAANEYCPQAQTREHLLALQIAGIKKIVVAQNKIDLVDKKLAKENYRQIKEFLKDTPYKDAVIIPTAAHFKTNIDLLIEAIEKEFPTPKFDLKKPLRMYCARSFDVNKPGTLPKDIKGGVIGGTIQQGKLTVGERIELSPGIEKPICTTVKGISIGDASLQEAFPGGLIAIETTLDPSITANDQMKGQLIGKEGELPQACDKLILEINFIEKVLEKQEQKFDSGEIIVLTIGTMTSIGTVVGLRKRFYEVVLKKPAVVEKGQQIAISKRKEMKWRLVAYGIVQ